jgi:hypothetical protein
MDDIHFDSSSTSIASRLLSGHIEGRQLINKMPRQLKASFKELGMNNLFIVGASQSVPNGFDYPFGVRPILAGISASWTDKDGPIADAYSPLDPKVLYFRVWLESQQDAKRLLMEFPRLMAKLGTSLRGNWYDLNRDVDLVQLRKELCDFAQDCGLKTYTDEKVIEMIEEEIATRPKAAD